MPQAVGGQAGGSRYSGGELAEGRQYTIGQFG